MAHLPDYIVFNLHRRYTGVSTTVQRLLPIQRQEKTIGLVDTGNLGLPGTIPLWHLFVYGWQKPSGKTRIFHARRAIDMQIGLFLKYVLRQPWTLLFTSAIPRKHGRFLASVIASMDAIIATSKRTASFLPWHSVVINHGVDTEYFTPPDQQEHRYWIGNFGRVRPSKGSDLLVDAAIKVLPHHPKWSLFFAGLAKDKAYLQAMEDKINAAGLGDRIVFIGQLDYEAARVQYHRCGLVIAASRREGFGLTPLEAMASGVPVVASGAGFWPELIKEGKNGVSFETGSCDDLVRALDAVLGDEKALARMGKFAREDVVAHHSIQQEASAINRFYDQLMKEHD